ncbi:MAG: hypothetical protein IIW52_05340 [Alistipes sp.]|nr:hypothetical protein [Alistipes sp.]
MKQYTKIIDGKAVIKAANQIVIRMGRAEIYQPTEEMILNDGWVEYVEEITTLPKSRMRIVQELVIKQWNERTDISDDEALQYSVIVYPWENLISQEMAVGKVVTHNGELWRVRQAHTASTEYAPSLNTAALWEHINIAHAGTTEDPIPYMPPMEVFEGKYYVENEVVYHCIRSSGTTLTHSLAALIGSYVEI